MKSKFKGIDISTFQKKVDFQKVKSDYIDFAILRAGFGRYESQKDKMFDIHYTNAKSVGLPVGAYWYSYAQTVAQAKQEAEVCARVLCGKQFEYPVFFDIEEISQANLGKSLCTHLCESFCDTLKEKSYYVGVYANKNWFTNYLDFNRLAKKYQIWLAQYNHIMTFNEPVHIWQYTSSGSVNGIDGKVDVNWCYVDYPSRIKSGGYNGFFSQSTNDKQESVEPEKINVFYRVRANGRWLPEVKNLEDYAGQQGQAITDVAIRVSKGEIWYRVHSNGRWLPWVSGYDINDFYGGYAGNKTPIDAVQIYYYTPNDIRPYQQAYYRVSEINQEYFDWQEDISSTNSMNGYAGNATGQPIDRIQIQIRER